jgi:hypothetical protein
MGQCESKARDFKEQKRRKTLEVRFQRIREKKQSKRRVIREKKQ